MDAKSKVMPCLWFDGNAEEAVSLYVSLFPNSKVVKVVRHGDTGPGEEGSVLTMTFQLDGREFMALNGGPQFKFTEAISLVASCETQAELDDLWAKLGAGGQEQQCGWLKDRFGLSWQVVPAVLGELMTDPDPARSARVMTALLGMVKLDIDGLKRARDAER